MNICGLLTSRMLCIKVINVINVKCSKKSTTPKVTVTYWKYEETEEGEDVTMTLIEFLVDYINGDLQINEPATF